jgi:formylglycine-generating enzyme required for sulfatase activity
MIRGLRIAAAGLFMLAACTHAPAPVTAFRDAPFAPEMIAAPVGLGIVGSEPAETERYKLAASFANRERPRREVRIERPFAIGKGEVTRGEFAHFVEATGYAPASPGCWRFLGVKWELDPALDWRTPGFDQSTDDPAVCISKRDAEAYLTWLSQVTGKRYRLPSEAEWEYAARAGAATARFWGEDFDCAYANGGDQAAERANGWAGKSLGFPDIPPWRPLACDDGFAATAPIGAKPANRFGLVHTIGNVQEWTADCWNDDHSEAGASAAARTDGDCTRAPLKGQGFTGSENVLRSAFRLKGDVGERRFTWGFRVSRDLD